MNIDTSWQLVRGVALKAALLVPRVTADPAANLDRVEQMTADAAGSGAGLVLLPEAVLTG